MLSIFDFAKHLLRLILSIVRGLNKLGLNIPVDDLADAYSQMDSVNLKEEALSAIGGVGGLGDLMG